jgi:hypothetical protein
MTLDEAIIHCEEVAEAEERKAKLYQSPDKNVKGSGRKYNACIKRAKEYRQRAEWLKELKWYREDTRFADLYERICIKRDDDREYFARTKDKTYITRIAEKEMFIHMMQDMMFDRYGVEEVNADE